MLGAIAGDVIGSVYEYLGWKETRFPSSPPTVPTRTTRSSPWPWPRRSWTGRTTPRSFARSAGATRMRTMAGTSTAGSMIRRWAPTRAGGMARPCGWSPVGLAFDSIERVIEEARRSAEVTHTTIRKASAARRRPPWPCSSPRVARARPEIKREVVAHSGYGAGPLGGRDPARLSLPTSPVRRPFHPAITCFLNPTATKTPCASRSRSEANADTSPRSRAPSPRLTMAEFRSPSARSVRSILPP